MRAVLFAALLALPACFNIDEPVCAYSCGPAGECPHDYECRQPDNFCHKVGSVAACEFSDAATQPDLSAASDMTADMPESTDGPMSADGSSTDL